jgi:hypothetical protein
MTEEHFRCPSVVAQSFEQRIFFDGQGTLGAVFHAEIIVFLAFETDAFVAYGSLGLCIVFIAEMHAVGAELGAESAGYAFGIPFDHIFPYGVSKTGRCFHDFGEFPCCIVIAHMFSHIVVRVLFQGGFGTRPYAVRVFRLRACSKTAS